MCEITLQVIISLFFVFLLKSIDVRWLQLKSLPCFLFPFRVIIQHYGAVILSFCHQALRLQSSMIYELHSKYLSILRCFFSD